MSIVKQNRPWKDKNQQYTPGDRYQFAFELYCGRYECTGPQDFLLDFWYECTTTSNEFELK